MGKWSVSWEAWSGRVYPAFCTGWLYVTSPRVALGLAEVKTRAVRFGPEKGGRERCDPRGPAAVREI